MTDLRSFLRRLFEKSKKAGKRRGFLLDEHSLALVARLARDKRMGQAEMLDDILQAGINKLEQDQVAYVDEWQSLSPREREVAALMGMGYGSHEIADILSVSYNTVKSHTHHIYVKFGLSRKELMNLLESWDLAAWWDQHRH